MTLPPLEPLPSGATILRVLEPKPPFFSDPSHRQPTRKAFEPNSGDIADAETRGVPVGVSVFDSARATPSQAIVVRQAVGGRALIEPRVYTLDVDSVRGIVRVYNRQGDVVRDAITGPGAEIDGAAGHALIIGLYEPDGTKRKRPEYKNMLDQVAMAALQVLPAERPDE